MIKIKAFLKTHLNKFIAALSALSISFTAAFTSLAPCASASSVTYADLLVDIASLSPAGVVIDYANLLLDVYLFFFEDAVTSDREIQRTKILAAWKTITDNSTMTEDQFADYWQQCIDELGLADDRLIMIEETVRLGFTLEDVINYCYHSDGDGVSVSDTGSVQITGQKFKQLVDYWSDYYKPKDTPTQYVYSLNDGGFTKNITSTSFKTFTPYCPVYTSSGGSNTGWGFKGWSDGVYILPFFDDDDLENIYYGKYYFHIYTIKSDDGTITIFMDIICLTDGSTYASRSAAWDFAYNTLAFSMTSKPFLYKYTSYFNFLSAATGTDGTWFLNVNDSTPSEMMSGSVASPLSNSLSDLLFDTSTFDPINNPSDDWGYILSSEPYDLWLNTDIDTTKIPDDYIVTINGDTVYDYSITNTAGDTTTINNYITNNYTVPETEKPDSGGGSSVGGDITVSGDIGVSGSVDVNVNVNVSNSDTEYDPTIDSYVDALPEQSDTINNYFSIFFSYLPAPLLALLLSGVAAAILARLLGR